MALNLAVINDLLMPGLRGVSTIPPYWAWAWSWIGKCFNIEGTRNHIWEMVEIGVINGVWETERSAWDNSSNVRRLMIECIYDTGEE